MNEEQFNSISRRLDKILAVLITNGIEDKDEKIYTLKKMGFNSNEISPIVGITNVRQTEGWKRT